MAGLAAPASLSPTQYVFCLAYLENGFNQTRAYRKAHPDASPATARTEGCRALRNPNIRALLNQRLDDAWKPLHIGGDQALARIAMLASDAPDDRIKLAALRTILEHHRRLRPPGDSMDALAEAIKADRRAHGFEN